MAWKLTTGQKVRAAAALIIVFLLILATNLIDRHHFQIVQKSLTTVYEDRLLVKDYIYKISRQIQLKRSLLHGNDQRSIAHVNKKANDSIRVLIQKYEDTRLTEAEAKSFAALQQKFNRLFQYEENYRTSESADLKEEAIADMERMYVSIYEELDALSAIQVGEGKRALDLSNKSIESSNLISRMEIGALVVIGLLLQLVIFLKPIE